MKRKLRVISDIHLDMSFTAKFKHGMREFDIIWSPTPHKDDAESILVIAGDIWVADEAFKRRHDQDSWIKNVAKTFHAVVIVLGNHDYWDASIDTIVEKCRAHLVEQEVTNVQILHNSTITIDDIKFVGGTLWTSFNNMNPLVVYGVMNGMNDSRYMRTDGNSRKVQAMDFFNEHKKTLACIEANAKRDYPEQSVVVVTHHAPSYRSVHSKYRNFQYTDLNFGYYTELSDMMYDPDFAADYWIHGHMHDAMDYEINNTNIICNPRGYGGLSQQNTGFNEFLFLDFENKTTT